MFASSLVKPDGQPDQEHRCKVARSRNAKGRGKEYQSRKTAVATERCTNAQVDAQWNGEEQGHGQETQGFRQSAL